jgi:NitT/TauT family transport system substrate-binding protein
VLVAVGSLTATPGWALDKMVIGTGVDPTLSQFYVGVEAGIFKKHGLDVEVKLFGSASASTPSLIPGDIQASLTSVPAGAIAHARAPKIVLVAMTDIATNYFGAVAETRLKSLADLRGQKVGVAIGSSSELFAIQALERVGMTLKDVQVVNLSAGDAAAAFMAGRVDAAVVWNPWVNTIQVSGKGKPLFSSADVPGLIPDLLVVQEKSLKAKRKDFVGMVKAWYDVEAFLRSNPDEAAKIMAKVVGMDAKDYKVFLPGTKFFDQKANLAAFGPATDKTSLLGVAPTISKFLLDNKLMEGKVDFAKGIDASLVKEVAGVK